VNVFTAIGNIGQDCETRFTKTGTAVVSFSVGISSGWGDRKTTTWVNCTVWGKKDGTAPPVAPYLVKGQKVGITGEITLREWESNGRTGTSLDCNVKDVTLCGEKKVQEVPDHPITGDTQPPLKPEHDFADDSIPF
jgi:single-strand DNA-binding protein